MYPPQGRHGIPRHLTLLALAAIAVAALTSFGGARPVAALGSCSGGDAALDGEEQAFLGLINGYRSGRGLATLAISPGLNRSAAWMVNDMATTGRFGHVDSLGRNPWTRLADCGNPPYGGENLAAGTERSTASSALEMLRNSPSHDAVMLSPEFRLIGIARQFVAGSPYGWYWATDFGNGDAAAEAAPVATVAPPPPATAAVVATPAAPQPQVAAPEPAVPVAAQQVAPVSTQPEPTAAPEPTPEPAAPPPPAWAGDAQLAAAILGSLAFEIGGGLSLLPVSSAPITP